MTPPDAQAWTAATAAAAAASPWGLAVTAALAADDADRDAIAAIAGADAAAGVRSITVFGFADPVAWRVFETSHEAADGAPHPLDRWSARAGADIAEALGGIAVFPFGGPPYAPFLRWMRAAPAWPSPLGMLIDAERGLWTSARLAIARPTDAPPPPQRDRPCDSCATTPCQTACPVNAFGPDGYDVAACAGHLRRPEGADCRERGCLARRACPIGRAFASSPAQAGFHMRAFLAARLKETEA